MAYDVPRFRRVMRTIEAEPETFNMLNYAQVTSCGTTMCLAGHTVADEGLAIRWRTNEAGEPFGNGLADGRSIHLVAAGLLGLDEDEADAIFLATNIETAESLWEQIEKVTGGAVTEHD